jgi:hypothetical protein
MLWISHLPSVVNNLPHLCCALVTAAKPSAFREFSLLLVLISRGEAESTSAQAFRLHNSIVSVVAVNM